MQRGKYSKTGGVQQDGRVYWVSFIYEVVHSHGGQCSLYSKAAIPEPVLCPRDPSLNSTALVPLLYFSSLRCPPPTLQSNLQPKRPNFLRLLTIVSPSRYIHVLTRPCPPLRCLPSTCPPPHAPAYALPRVLPRLRTGRRPCMRHDGEVNCDAHCTWHVFCRCMCHVSPPCLATTGKCGSKVRCPGL